MKKASYIVCISYVILHLICFFLHAGIVVNYEYLERTVFSRFINALSLLTTDIMAYWVSTWGCLITCLVLKNRVSYPAIFRTILAGTALAYLSIVAATLILGTTHLYPPDIRVLFDAHLSSSYSVNYSILPLWCGIRMIMVSVIPFIPEILSSKENTK